MHIHELQSLLDNILPPGFLIELSESGEVVIFTNLTEEDDLLVPMVGEDDLDFDNDDDGLEEDYSFDED